MLSRVADLSLLDQKLPAYRPHDLLELVMHGFAPFEFKTVFLTAIIVGFVKMDHTQVGQDGAMIGRNGCLEKFLRIVRIKNKLYFLLL